MVTYYGGFLEPFWFATHRIWLKEQIFHLYTSLKRYHFIQLNISNMLPFHKQLTFYKQLTFHTC